MTDISTDAPKPNGAASPKPKVMALPSAKATASEVLAELKSVQRRVVHVPAVGEVHVPHPHDLAYYAGMAAMAAVELIEWPIALIVAGGHALAKQHHSKSLKLIGEILEEA